ncbi:MAG: hypothetical protein ISS93_03485 [Candidatus Aenigmarchaeota archaeon]|nr:hypothetical protein [Candidatus Aenigmarchaeota archaeon]
MIRYVLFSIAFYIIPIYLLIRWVDYTAPHRERATFAKRRGLVLLYLALNFLFIVGLIISAAFFIMDILIRVFRTLPLSGIPPQDFNYSLPTGIFLTGVVVFFLLGYCMKKFVYPKIKW